LRVNKAYSQLAKSDMMGHAGLQQYNPSSGNQRGVSRDQSRGRTGDSGHHPGHNLSTTLGPAGAGGEAGHRQGLPTFKKNPSSPSKIFKQYQQPSLAQHPHQQAASRSPFRHDGRLRDPSEATQVSLGPG